ncbi:CzcA family heavy metal efflux pump [Desulfobaculum xiamenense]|uniref:CzcA family heavy metal efflux pump n=1 Tax=Desulfobaculum xiamenense TaxID=995050 RepID=A0A846QJY2_9BACT|nr:efflux RND transporter permease subunit [Desulfobaculum xiamenense]NJB67427.1 CzcA family heavy metal efflux pump [Desulfobaculum xiamenense]
MIVNRSALKRQSTVLVLLAFIVTAGLSAYEALPLESNPDITIPYIFVSTEYEGVAPEDMEKLITIPIERKLRGLKDVEEIKSTSVDGSSVISIKFLPRVDIDDALQKVRDKVDQAKPDLPPDLPDDPVIIEMNFSDMPIINVVLSGPFSLKRLKSFADDMEDRFESIPGVLDAELIGGLEREIHVLFDLDRVAFYRMPFSELVTSVESANVNVPGGSMDIGTSKYLVRVPEDFHHPSEIDSVVAFVRGGKPVYLRDVAVIADASRDPLSRSRFDGEKSVTIAIKKRSGENIIDIADEVKRIVREMETEMPPALRIDITSDQSKDIRLMVADLQNNIISGLVLVLAVVFVFIGGRSALFVSLAIPLSMLITFILLQASGVTLNMVVLFSLILALGMLVDNGIVVVENIYRHMQNGSTRQQAALAATDEVAWPVIASTLTTVGAFAPMLFWPGIMGEFMSYLPLTVIMALSGSLFVALVINPVLSARFQTIRKENGKRRPMAQRALDHVQNTYARLLDWSLDHRLVVLGVALASLVTSAMAFGMFGKGVEFFPDADPRRAFVNIKAPVGTNLDASDAIVTQVEQVVSAYPDVVHTIEQVGSEGGDPFSSDGSGTHVSTVTMEFKDFHERSRTSAGIVDEVRGKLLAAITGAEIRAEKEQDGPPTGAPINLEITGRDIHELGRIVTDIRERIRTVPGLVDLKDNFVEGKPEIRVDVDKEKAAIMGLSTAVIANTVKAAIGGVKAGSYREGKDEYDIVAKLPEKDRTSVESIRRLTVSGPDGKPIPLTSVASVRLASGLGGIQHIDQQRVVTISADVSGRLANDIIADISARLKDYQWPRGYSHAFTGEQEEQAKASAFLGKAFVAALFIIFLVLVTQFDSLAMPLVILTSVVLSLVGVFVGLLVTRMPFGVIMTGVGVISLAGVVVNNAIVLIDYFQQLKARGMAAREALMETGRTRFRPVLLTAITTILGLIPMATGVSFDFLNFRWEVGSESAQWWGPMAVAVIFGLLFATLLTLVVVPVLCSLVEDAHTRALRRAERRAAAAAD